jgi:hypothetical protein
MGCAGGVNGSLSAHEWEGKSVKTHMDTFGQVHVHIRYMYTSGNVHVDKSGVCVCSLVVVVLRELVRGGKGAWAWVEWHSRPRCGMTGETTRRRSLLEGNIYKKKVGRRGRWL